MSSSDGPYKSRLFNFFNRQYMRIGDRLKETVRQVGVLVEWSTQIVLYPIYTLIQAGRTVHRQLRSSQHQQHQVLLSPASDHPLKEVITAIQPWIQDYYSQEKALETDIPTVQGLVSQLGTHQLAVITPQQEIIPLFDSAQQEALEKYMIWQLADYYHDKQKYALPVTTTAPVLPPITVQPKLLFPLRLFWQSMAWIEQGKLAKTLNLFQEKTLVSIPSQPVITPPKIIPLLQSLFPETPPLLSVEKLTVLDQQLLHLENEQLYPLYHRIKDSLEPRLEQLHLDPDALKALIRSAFNYFNRIRNTSAHPKLAEPTSHQDWEADYTPRGFTDQPYPTFLESQRTISSIDHQQETLSTPLPRSQKITSENPFSLHLLISAAIDYFFHRQMSPKPLPSSSESLPESKEESFEDPWLVWGELFEEIAPNRPEPMVDRSYLPPLPNYRPPASKSMARKRKKPPSNSEAIIPSDDHSVEHNPDWLDIPATTTGYVKHPLEVLLEWFDSIMLWLEELILSLWQWFTRKE